MNIHNNARLMPIGRERIVMQGRPRYLSGLALAAIMIAWIE